MRRETLHLRTVVDSFSTLAEELTAVTDKTLTLLADVTNIKKRNATMEIELVHWSNSLAVSKNQCESLKANLLFVKNDSAKFRVEIASLRTSRNNFTTGLQQKETRVGDALSAVTSSVKNVQIGVFAKMR